MTRVGQVYTDSMGERFTVVSISDNEYVMMQQRNGCGRGMSLKALAWMISTAQLRTA